MVEALERIDRLRGGLMNVDQTLVRPDLEVLLGVLVLEGGLHHGVHVLLGRQRHGAGDSGASPRRGLDDLLGRGLDGRRVVRLETDADLVLGYGHVLSGTWSEISAGFLRAMRAAPGLRGPPSSSRICRPLALSAAGYGARCGRTTWLFLDLRHDAGAHGAATLADGEAQAGVHGDRLDQLDLHLDVVARHDHLRALGQVGDAGHVRRAEVELRPVPVEERSVAATLLLLEHVDLSHELRVRGDRVRLAENLPALDLLALDAAEQAADVVAGAPLIEDLAEHLDAGDDRGADFLVDADDLHGVARVDDALLDAARGHRAATRDREDILDRHQERLVQVALGLRDVRVQLVAQLDDLVDVLLVALERLQRRADDERDVVAREVVLVEQVAHLDLDELQELLVVDHVGLVEEHDDVRHAHLTGEQDVLARLRHRAVGRRDHEDRA